MHVVFRAAHEEMGICRVDVERFDVLGENEFTEARLHEVSGIAVEVDNVEVFGELLLQRG